MVPVSRIKLYKFKDFVNQLSLGIRDKLSFSSLTGDPQNKEMQYAE